MKQRRIFFNEIVTKLLMLALIFLSYPLPDYFILFYFIFLKSNYLKDFFLKNNTWIPWNPWNPWSSSRSGRSESKFGDERPWILIDLFWFIGFWKWIDWQVTKERKREKRKELILRSAECNNTKAYQGHLLGVDQGKQSIC